MAWFFFIDPSFGHLASVGLIIASIEEAPGLVIGVAELELI